ncbi:hypothetical protein FOZ62_012293, partial [Perkinsus olseni]
KESSARELVLKNTITIACLCMERRELNRGGGGGFLVIREVLPTTFEVLQYDVHLSPSFETSRFEGSVDVRLNVLEATSSIVLNAQELLIDPEVTFKSGDEELKAVQVVVD